MIHHIGVPCATHLHKPTIAFACTRLLLGSTGPSRDQVERSLRLLEVLEVQLRHCATETERRKRTESTQQAEDLPALTLAGVCYVDKRRRCRIVTGAFPPRRPIAAKAVLAKFTD